MPRRQPQLPSLSPAEWEVMKVFWNSGPLAARDVHAALAGRQDWVIKTVKTLLSRLVVKGALDYVEVGNSYLYKPRHGREEMTLREVDEFVERVLDGGTAPALAHFLRSSKVSAEDLGHLRALLDQKERELSPRGRKS